MRKLLLHTCCVPCGVGVFERLIEEREYEITSFFYNPNIRPFDEWERRLSEFSKLGIRSEELGVINAAIRMQNAEIINLVVPEQNVGEFDRIIHNSQFIIHNYGLDLVVPSQCEGEFLREIKGLEGEKEGGKRCEVCFRLRLERTAEWARENGYPVFGTTLTVSPHKNAELINRLGREIGEKWGMEFLERDFKKRGGYLRSIELCRELGIYRQQYCGCGMGS